MASPSAHLSRLEKVAVFLIVIGPQKARQVLHSIDLATVEAVNVTMSRLGDIPAAVRAAVMIEFAGFFYEDKPLTAKLKGSSTSRGQGNDPPNRQRRQSSSQGTREKLRSMPRTSESDPKEKPHKLGITNKPSGPAAAQMEMDVPPKEEGEQAAARALEHMRKTLDPEKIDWGKAGYDFGEGFQGSRRKRR